MSVRRRAPKGRIRGLREYHGSMEREDQVVCELKVGDTVFLRGGGVPMTVVRLYTSEAGRHMAETEYAEDGRSHRATHACDELVVREPFLEEDGPKRETPYP